MLYPEVSTTRHCVFIAKRMPFALQFLSILVLVFNNKSANSADWHHKILYKVKIMTNDNIFQEIFVPRNHARQILFKIRFLSLSFKFLTDQIAKNIFKAARSLIRPNKLKRTRPRPFKIKHFFLFVILIVSSSERQAISSEGVFSSYLIRKKNMYLLFLFL